MPYAKHGDSATRAPLEVPTTTVPLTAAAALTSPIVVGIVYVNWVAPVAGSMKTSIDPSTNTACSAKSVVPAGAMAAAGDDGMPTPYDFE